MHLSLYNKRNMQNTGEINFPVNLLSDYLVIPNNLLLSLSLSLSLIGATGVTHLYNILMYAREARRASPTGKGLHDVPLPGFLCPFAKWEKGEIRTF